MFFLRLFCAFPPLFLRSWSVEKTQKTRRYLGDNCSLLWKNGENKMDFSFSDDGGF